MAEHAQSDDGDGLKCEVAKSSENRQISCPVFVWHSNLFFLRSLPRAPWQEAWHGGACQALLPVTPSLVESDHHGFDDSGKSPILASPSGAYSNASRPLADEAMTAGHATRSASSAPARFLGPAPRPGPRSRGRTVRGRTSRDADPWATRTDAGEGHAGTDRRPPPRCEEVVG
jgi:hypothetical protein